ncbi:hypothetical protein ACUX4R_28840, partial [Salmonella enterica]
ARTNNSQLESGPAQLAAEAPKPNQTIETKQTKVTLSPSKPNQTKLHKVSLDQYNNSISNHETQTTTQVSKTNVDLSVKTELKL